MAIERIVDGVDKNNFGVLFHSTKAIEEFQKRSGMNGAYTTEYQHHYIALIARLEADGQRLDLAIPMCMFNYHQEVGGASVEFNLGEVGEANSEAMEKAIEKFNEFETTEMYKQLLDMGVQDFKLEGMHSIHAHPNGVNRFSGTDLRADIKHPGVNFPLSVGENVANFASIIQHRQNFAEIIHTEYRIFNGEEDGERNYKKGRTLTIVKGYEFPKLPEPKPLPPGPIDNLFGTKRPQPPKQGPIKDRKDYVLQDGFEDADDKKLELMAEEFMNMWKECEFEIDVSHVLKTNITKGAGRLLNKNTNVWGYNRKSRKDYKSLFDAEWEDEVSQKTQTEKIEDVPLWKMKSELIQSGGFTAQELLAMTADDIEDVYWLEKLDELEDEKAGISIFTRDEYIDMLAADRIMTEEKLNMLNDKDLKDLVTEVYGAW